MFTLFFIWLLVVTWMPVAGGIEYVFERLRPGDFTRQGRFIAAIVGVLFGFVFGLAF